MTDLSKARQYADPWGGVEEEFAPESVRRAGAAVKEYVQPRSFLRRGFYPALEPDRPMPSWEDMISGKADEGLDQPTVSMLPAKGLKELRHLQKLKTQHRLRTGWSRTAAGAVHKMELRDIREAVNAIPRRMWDRIRSIKKLKGDPKDARALHSTAGSLEPGIDTADVWFHPEAWEPQDILHEIVGHEGSEVVGEVVEKIGNRVPNLKAFRLWWDEIHGEMNVLQRWLKREGGDAGIANRVYRKSPDEIFSRYVEGNIYSQGGKTSDSIVTGFGQVYDRRNETLAAFREGLVEAQKIQRRLGEATGDIEGVMKYFTDAKRFKMP